MSELKELIKLLTDKGFLSFKKIVNYAFPNKEQEGPKITDKLWIRALAYLAPILAIVILPILYLNPPSFFTIFPHLGPLFHLIILGYATFFTLFLLFSSLTLKIKNRSPTLLLLLTPFAPIKALLIFGVINFVFTASGFEQTAKEIISFDLRPTEAQQRIKKEQMAIRESHERATAKFNEAFNETRTKLRSLNSKRKDSVEQKSEAFVDSFEKEWKDRDRRWEERRKESDAAIKKSSEQAAKDWQKAQEDFKASKGIGWKSKKQLAREESLRERQQVDEEFRKAEESH